MAKTKAAKRPTARKSKPRKPAARKLARSAAPVETRAADSPAAKEFRALAGRFDLIDASEAANGETAVRELSVIAAKSFKRAVDAGLIVGFQADFPWPDAAKPFQSQADVELWATLWGFVASAVCHAMPSKAPIDPRAPRLEQVATIVEQPLADGVDRGRTPAVGPCVSSSMAGTIAPEDWRKRATRFATVCGLIADEINGRNSGALAVYIGGRKLRIGDGPPIVLAEQFDHVLRGLLELGGSADTAALDRQSGMRNFARVLREGIRRQPELKPFIILPGAKSRGGYRTTIRRGS